MKKFVYLCGMMLLCMNMMAQIDLNDRNWENVLDEQFDEDSSYWLWDHESFLNLGDHSWMGYLGGNLAPPGEYEIYQFNNCQISTIDNTMRLVAYYDSANIHQNNYYLPKWMWPEYNGSGYPPNGNKLYFSGAIEYYKKRYVQNEDERKFLYGYFEIRCKLPTHQGAFPAFWLHGANKSNTNPYYEEIDIFEYGWWITSPSGINPNPPGLGSNKCYTCGLYYNDTAYSHKYNSYARTFPLIQGSSGVDDYHTYSCIWMPDQVIWYFDGVVMNEYHNVDSIPRRPMSLKANYAIDNYCKHGEATWQGPDEMVIDHIKVYQLIWDCNKDETITCQSDLEGFEYAVKKSVTITSSTDEPIIIRNNDKTTFRVTDSFEILGSFEVTSEAEFTVITQSCPTSNRTLKR